SNASNVPNSPGTTPVTTLELATNPDSFDFNLHIHDGVEVPRLREPNTNTHDHPHSEPQYDDSLPEGIPSFGHGYEESKRAMAFRQALQNATLENDKITADELERLRNPSSKPTFDSMDRDLQLSLKLFVSTSNSPNAVYDQIRQDLLEDDPNRDIYSHHRIKNELASLTGIVPMVHDMCPGSCMAYTGPYSDRDKCDYCGTSRLDDQGKPRQKFYTMPIGPQLQSRFSNPETAELMGHRARETSKIMQSLIGPNATGIVEEYSDVYHGQDYLEAVHRGDIKPDDIVLMFSMDGAQLYRDKQ
ncbi:hypothetical protein CVT24_012954, partial [Panaeolus cyanescens]